MRYLQDEGFSVAMSGGKEYRDSWDRIFGTPGGDVKEDGCFLTMTGEVAFVERVDGVETTHEPVDGKLVLQLVFRALEEFLDREERDARGAAKRGTKKARAVVK